MSRGDATAMAAEQAVYFAARHYTPRQAIEAAGVAWGLRRPSWNDVVFALAMAWRDKCRDKLSNPTPSTDPHPASISPLAPAAAWGAPASNAPAWDAAAWSVAA